MDGFYVGNIVGSSYSHEHDYLNEQTKDFNFFTNRSKYSDDTIFTFVTMDWLLHTHHTSKEMIDLLKKYYNLFPDTSPSIYGKEFVHWIETSKKCKKSSSNSCTTQASAIGWFSTNIEEIRKLVKEAISPTHDTLEAILSAEVVAIAVFMMKNNRSKEELKKYLDLTYDYYLDQKLALLRNAYEFTNDAKETVRPAIIAFLESNSFEDSIRNAVSLGGDCDTIAAINGAIAEAYYKVIPSNLIKSAKKVLPKDLLPLLDEFKKYVRRD